MKNGKIEITHNNFHKMIGIVLHPSIALKSIKPIIKESIFTLLILYLLLSTKGVMELITIGKGNIIIQLLLGIAIGLVAAWSGITILFHFVAKNFGGKENSGTHYY